VLREVGLVLGVFFIVAFALIVDYSIQLLNNCARILIEQKNERYLKERSYEAIGKIVYGETGGMLVRALVDLDQVSNGCYLLYTTI